MKKTLLILGLLFTLNSFGQIVLEHKYTDGYYRPSLYWEVAENETLITNYGEEDYQYRIYNLNHTLYLEVDLTNITPLDNYGPIYLSRHLFDNDNDLEYMAFGENTGIDVLYIFNEDGSILFEIDSIRFDVGIFNARNENPFAKLIVNSENGTKLITPMFGATVNIYSLPGKLLNSNKINEPINKTYNNFIEQSYPNPATKSTTIEYSLPEGIRKGEIVFYNLNGQEIKSFIVTNDFTNINISTSELSVGTYLYNLQTEKGISDGKKMIIIK